MPTLIPHPTRIQTPGSKPKIIEEYVGRVNSQTSGLSVAHMRSPEGWEEPGQTPDFDEYTLVLHGTLRVHHKDGILDVAAGQAVITHQGGMDLLLEPRGRRSGIYRGLPACVLARHSSSRRLMSSPAGLQSIRLAKHSHEALRRDARL